VDNSTPSLNVKRTETAPCCCDVSIELPAERVQKIYKTVVAKIGRQAKLPGFRAGKVPQAMLLSRYDKEIKAEVLEQLLNEGYRGMIAQEKLEVASSPEVKEMESLVFELGQPFMFQVACEYAPSFDLPEYKGLHLSRESAAVNEEQVDEAVTSWLESRQTFVKLDRPAQQQDMLQVSYRAELPEGLELPEKAEYLVKAENSWLVLREPEMLPGVMTALVGVNAGDEKDLTLQFPADYREEALAGKSLPYHFSIKEVHGMQVPELTEELAKEVGTEGIDDLRSKMKEQLEEQMKRTQEAQLRQQATTTLLSGFDFPLPPTQLKQEKEAILKRYYDEEVRQGKNPDELRDMSQEMATRAEEEAVSNLRRHFVLDAIAKAENITVSNNEISSMVSYFARYERVSPKVMFKRMQENGQIPSLMENLTVNKVIDKLIEWADIVDVPAVPGPGKEQA
jgi:trigger factor